jgi:hypothetical protein
MAINLPTFMGFYFALSRLAEVKVRHLKYN